MFKLLKKLRTDKNGATAIEYGLIAALVAIAAILGMNALGTSLNNIFGGVADTLDAETPTT